MPFNSSSARAAFFKKLKEEKGNDGLAADIVAKFPKLEQIKTPKLQQVSETSKPMKFKKIRTYMKG